MRRGLAVLLAALLALWPLTPVWAQSGGNCSVFRTWNTGDSLTAGDLNSSFSTVGVTNMTQACIDGISDSLAGMQTKTDPFAGGTESLATSGAGEIQRLRWVLHILTGWQDWYREDQNLNFATGSGVQGSGIGRHVTAVGFHSWTGFTQGAPRPAQFPAVTSVADHWTGFAWPARGHISVVIGDVVNENGGVKGGVEMLRLHAQGVILHHTAALMFAHSTAFSPGQQSSAGHITAVTVSRGLVSAAGNEAAGRDTLLFGHAGTVMQLVGYGASHVALGTRGYVSLGRHVAAFTPLAGALYADSIPKAWATFDGTVANIAPAAGFNVAGITDVSAGYYIVNWVTPFTSANYVVQVTAGMSGASPLIGLVESQATTHANVRVFNFAGTPTDSSYVGVSAFGAQ